MLCCNKVVFMFPNLTAVAAGVAVAVIVGVLLGIVIVMVLYVSLLS